MTSFNLDTKAGFLNAALTLAVDATGAAAVADDAAAAASKVSVPRVCIRQFSIIQHEKENDLFKNR